MDKGLFAIKYFPEQGNGFCGVCGNTTHIKKPVDIFVAVGPESRHKEAMPGFQVVCPVCAAKNAPELYNMVEEFLGGFSGR